MNTSLSKTASMARIALETDSGSAGIWGYMTESELEELHFQCEIVLMEFDDERMNKQAEAEKFMEEG